MTIILFPLPSCYRHLQPNPTMDSLPLSFGKKAPPKKANVKRKLEETRRDDVAPVKEEVKPTAAAQGKKRGFEEVEDASPEVKDAAGGDQNKDDDDDGDVDDGVDTADDMPVSHEVVLKDHSKVCFMLYTLSSTLGGRLT